MRALNLRIMNEKAEVRGPRFSERNYRGKYYMHGCYFCERKRNISPEDFDSLVYEMLVVRFKLDGD